MTSCTATNQLGIPMLGFGTSQIENCSAAVTEALRLGYRHIDTAEFYNTEEGVGAAVASTSIPRKDIFITTKLFPGNEAWKIPEKNYEASIAACQASLKRLQVDYIDLYLIHNPLSRAFRLEQWRALVDLQKQGLVKQIGVSNYGKHHLQEIEEAGLPMPAVNQIEIHPLNCQWDILKYMSEHNIAPIAYSSLAPLTSWRNGEGSVGTFTVAQRADTIKEIEPIARRFSKTAGQVLLKWALQHGYPIIPKSSQPERIKENMELFDFELTTNDMATLDQLDRKETFAWAKLGVGYNPLEQP